MANCTSSSDCLGSFGALHEDGSVGPRDSGLKSKNVGFDYAFDDVRPMLYNIYIYLAKQPFGEGVMNNCRRAPGPKLEGYTRPVGYETAWF